MSRLLFTVLAIIFFVVLTDEHPVLVQSSAHAATQKGARSVVRCIYWGPRGLEHAEIRFIAQTEVDPPSCPILRPKRLSDRR